MTQQPPPFTDTWLWNSSTPPAASGEVRTNQNTWTNVTTISLSNTSQSGDVTAQLDTVKGGDLIRLELDASRYGEYEVLDVLTGTPTDHQFSVGLSSSSGNTPNQNNAVSVTVTPQIPVVSTAQIGVTLHMHGFVTTDQYTTVLQEIQDVITRYRFLIQSVTTNNIEPDIVTVQVSGPRTTIWEDLRKLGPEYTTVGEEVPA